MNWNQTLLSIVVGAITIVLGLMFYDWTKKRAAAAAAAKASAFKDMLDALDEYEVDETQEEFDEAAPRLTATGSFDLA